VRGDADQPSIRQLQGIAGIKADGFGQIDQKGQTGARDQPLAAQKAAFVIQHHVIGGGGGAQHAGRRGRASGRSGARSWPRPRLGRSGPDQIAKDVMHDAVARDAQLRQLGVGLGLERGDLLADACAIPYRRSAPRRASAKKAIETVAQRRARGRSIA
jgi:hypothetical protein